MSSPESASELPQQKPDGERWLEMLGYGHLKGQPTGYEVNGEPVMAEQFDLLCRDNVAPMFVALERMDPADPRYKKFIGIGQAAFKKYFFESEDDA
jgi:hypothetical protein